MKANNQKFTNNDEWKTQDNNFLIPDFKSKCEQIVNYFGEDVQILRAKEKLRKLANKIYLSAQKDDILNELAETCITLMRLKIVFQIDENKLYKKIDEKVTNQINYVNKLKEKKIWRKST